MRKRGKKLLAIMLAASMTLGQGSTWTLAQEEVAETIEGAALNAQAEEAGAEEIGDEGGQDTPSGDSEDTPTPGEEETGDSESDNSSENNQGTGDNSGENPSEDNNQGTGDDSGFSDETGGGDTSDNNGNQDGNPENPDGITDGEQKDETPENGKTDFHYEDAKIIIDAKATAEAGFKEDTVLKADYLDPEGTDEQKAAYQNAVEIIRQQLGETLTNNNEKATLDYVLYDVYFESQTGERLEPAEGTVEVTMSFKEPVKLETKDPETNEQNYELLNQEVVHIQQDENDTKTAELVQNSNIQIENDQITSATFTQDSFSVMGLVWAKAAVQSASNGATLSAVKLSDEKNKSVWGDGIITGSGDLDEISWDPTSDENRGYDNSSSNNIIRSFDSIVYNVSSTITNMHGEAHTLVYEVTLPDDSEITLDDQKMSAQISSQKNADKTVTYICKYELKADYAGGEKTENITVKIGNKHQGDEIKPTIKAYLDLDVASALEVSNMQPVIVTTAPMYNIVLQEKNNVSKNRDIYDFAENMKNVSENCKYENNASGYADSKVNGYKRTFAFALELRKPKDGIKGVEIPSGEFKFDIDLSDTHFSSAQQTYNLAEQGFEPLLYYVGENQPGGGATTSLPFTKKYNANFENTGCHNSGNVTMTQEGTTLHVTVKDFAIDMTKFPKENYDKKSYWEDLNKIREGIFSAFQFQVVYPYINKNGQSLQERFGDGSVNLNVEVKNMSAVSEVNTPTQTETFMTDNKQSDTVPLLSGSGRNQEIFYSSRDNKINPYSPEARRDDKDIAAVGANDLAFTVTYSENNLGEAYPVNNMPVAIDQFILFDRNAIGNVAFTGDVYQGGTEGYTCSVRYAVRKNGRMDNECMRSASLADFDFYDTNPGECDAVLVQYRGANLGDPKLELRAQFYATVRQEASLVDHVYMITAFTNTWTATDFENDILEYANKTSLSDAKRVDLSNWGKQYNTASEAYDLVNGKTPTQATIDPRSKYTVPEYENKVYKADPNHRSSDTWADALYIVPYTTTVTKTVAQVDEKGNSLQRYNIGDGQRYVDYRISSSIVYWGQVQPESGSTTTVYLKDTIPAGLTYIPGSAYWGGTYTSKYPLRGEVTGGTQIEPESKTENGKTVLTWTIPKVELKNGELPTLYYSCKIDMTVEDNANLQNEVTIQTNEDKRPIHKDNDNISIAGISVTRRREFYIVKRGGGSLELEDNSYYELVAANTSSTDKKDLCLIDTMPYADENIKANESKQMKGKYQITSLTMDAVDVKHATDMEIWYTNSRDYIGKTAENISAEQVTEENGWKKADASGHDGDTITFTGDGLIESWPTAIAYKDDNLEKDTIVTLRLGYQVVAGAENDDFVNRLSTMSNGIEIKSDAETDIYKRTLEGTVWFDKNQDGKIDDDEAKLEGVKVTLFIENESGDYVKYTPYKETVDGKTYTSPNTVLTDKNGHYKFTGLPAGKYRVTFESSDGTSLGHYDVTNANADIDKRLTSKVEQGNISKDGEGILKSGTITNITMPSLKEMVKNNQKTYNLPDQNLGLIIPEIKITGKKIWDDRNNQDGKRPDSIKIKLYGKVGDEDKELIANKEATIYKGEGDNLWTWEFTGLPKYAEENLRDLQEIVYTVEEEKVDDYTTNITGDAKNGFTIKNTYVTEVTSVSGSKTWDDSDDQDGKRPESITVRLKADGKEVDEVKADKDGNWSWKFKNLPKYSAGKEIKYTVTEDAINGYVSAVDGYNIINKYTPGKTSLTVTKAWEDGNNQDGKRPDSITVHLYADGNDTGKTLILKADKKWSGTFENLDINKKKGQKITYTVKEDTATIPTGYTVKVTGNMTTGYTITNTYTPEVISVKGTKIWNDSNNWDGIRPEKILIRLFADENEIKSKEVKETDGKWDWSFENLPKYNEGKEISYTVTEDTVNGYTSEITGDMKDGFTVTNTHTPTPYTPSNPDPKPSVTPTPTATPTPSTTPTPSAAPTPSETPKPSVTPPAEETPTPAPAAGSITVTKKLKVNGTPVGAENQKFYVALFEDEDCTQRASEVKTLTFQYASSATVTFDNLEPGKTYYVSETDENGEAILAGILDSGDIYTADFTNGNIVSVDGKNGSTVNFDNEFEDIPDGFYYVGNLKVTKTLLGSDGKAKNSDKTFYAGVFADADHTKLSDQVAKNIIPLSLNGASSVSDEVEVYMENADSVVKLYVTEVDKNGTPVEKDSSFAYSVTVKDGNATISKDALDARVVITNQEKNNPTPQGGGDTPSTQGGGSNPQSYSSGSSSVTPVKTGDSTPVMAMLLLLAASALVISTVMAKKKKSK